MGIIERISTAIVGRRVELPPPLVSSFPELASVAYRRGGIPPVIAGWALGRRTVSAVTLRRTVFLAPNASLDPALLLHELRHAQQFFESRTFPLRYVWESVRHGYESNRYERDARHYAAQRLAASPSPTSARDV